MDSHSEEELEGTCATELDVEKSDNRWEYALQLLARYVGPDSKAVALWGSDKSPGYGEDAGEILLFAARMRGYLGNVG